MDFVVDNVKYYYNLLLSSGDARVKDWPLVQSPFPTLFICLSYAYFVKVIGPFLMKNREPLNIRWLMVTYNLFMVALSTWLFCNLGVYGWFGKYDYRCQPVDYSDSPEAMGMARSAWYYYITKFIEFVDTFFFVARKKFSHISTLHVIHHGIMPMSVWWGMKYAPGGHSSFFGFINSFVHIPMYLYYGLSAIGPHMNKYLFWKKYMTSLQMIQFVAIFVHSFQLLFRDCDYPIEFVYWIGSHAILFWFLFWDFFKKTYLTSSKGAREGQGKKANGLVKNGHAPTQFACSPTETLLNCMNGDAAYTNGSVQNGNGVTTNGSVKNVSVNGTTRNRKVTRKDQ